MAISFLKHEIENRIILVETIKLSAALIANLNSHLQILLILTRHFSNEE